MSSKGKRSSILKKQPSILGPSSNENGSPTATSSSVNKTAKKIGFHHKKSIKEFVVGENTETIWGNSYEVSTDGTSPRIVTDDSTLTNGHDQSKPNTQNKENVSCVLAQSSVDNAISYPSPNNTWDLSITIADDERRRIRSDNSVCASQSLNTTERLMVEPPCTQPPALGISLNEARAIDVSPMKMHVSQTAAVKSPRKMIYYNPQADLIVNIADVPTQAVNQVEQQTRGKGPEHNTNLTCFQPNDDCSPKHSMLGNVSETWNSHPQAAFRMKQLRPSFDALADASSDFDNTVAITNTVAKLLEDCPNLTLSVPSNMELDESTVTDVKLPTNALSRARPSFLPSNSRRSCAMEEEQTETTNMPLKSIQKENLSSARPFLNDPVPMDISSPLEGRLALGNFTLDNLSISGDDIQQSVATYRRSSVKSSGLPMDFGISSMSLKLPPNSPEPSTAVGRPKILRPNFPLTTLYNVVSNLKPDPIVSTERDYRETILTATEMDETKQVEYERGKSLAPMDVTHVEQSNIKPVEPKRPSRATVHQLANMSSDDEAILAALSQPRTTILSREMMQLSHNSPPKGTPMEESRLAIATEKRHTVYDQPLTDETLAVPTVDRKRVTTHDPVTMSETKRTTVSEVKHSTFLEKTISEEQMILQQPLGTISNVIHPSASRQTIFCNESMVMDGSEPSISRATSIACVVYSENIDPLSVHAANKTNTVNLKITHATCVLDSLQESARNSSQPYVHHGQKPPQDCDQPIRERRATTCVPVAMDEEPLENEAPNDGQARLPIINETNEERSGRSPGPQFRATLHQWENMDETKPNEQNGDGHMDLTTCCRSSLHEEGREKETAVPNPIESRTRCTTFQRIDMDATKVVDHYGEDKHSQFSRKTIYCRDEMDETCAEREQVCRTNIDADTYHLRPTTPNISAMDETLDVHSTKPMSLENANFMPTFEKLECRANSDEGEQNPNLHGGEVTSKMAREYTRQDTEYVPTVDILRGGDPRMVLQTNGLSSVGNSPMNMSPTVVIDLSKNNTRTTVKGSAVVAPVQRSRQSIYQPCDMEQTVPVNLVVTQRKEDRKCEPISESLQRSSVLRMIVQQTPKEDMEGFSILTDDDDRGMIGNAAIAYQYSSTRPRATVFFTETAGQMDETATACADRHQIREDNQLTGHEAVAMEEATCVLPKAHHLAYSTAEGKRPSPSSVGQRKSSVCMEETLAPSVVRIERSGPRFDDSSDQPLSPNSESLRGTMCPKQDALDTTMANSVTIPSKGQQIVEAPEQDQQVKARPRQTILIPQDMEIEEHEQEPAVAKEESFSLPMLVRETTEDCAIRRVPSMATAGRAWTSGMFSTDAFGSKAHKSLSDSVSRVTITKDGAQHKQWLASYTHQPIDISASTSYLRTEPSEIGNISGHMMSMRELIDPLAPELHEICDAVGHRAQGNITKQSKSIAPEPPISDDEFFDAEADQGHPVSGEDTSRAITKSRQLLHSMKFVDVEQLEHTYTAKRVHARLVSSPIVQRSEKDPLHVTQLAHRRTAEQMTPQGPSTKKTRVSQSPQSTISVASQQHDRGQEIVNSTAPPEPEMVLIKQETEEAVPPLQTLILDPSVFVIDEEDLLDDESKLPSLTDEHLGACEESQQSDSDSERSSQAAHSNRRPLKDVSYYREYANVTLNGLGPASSDEEDEPALVAAVPTQLEQGQDPVVEVGECITISDDSTTEPLVVTDDRATVSGRVLESSLANEFIEKLRLKYPSKSRQPCCGVRGDCLCRAKRKLERQKKAIEDVWQWWRNKWPNLPRSPTTNSWEDKWEELRWKISETKQNHIATVSRNKNEPETSTSGKPTRPIRTICRPPFCGMYPETPDPVFLIRNLRQWLAEQQQQASPGATLPEVPRFTKLIANKLATETHWKLDHSEEMILDHLVLRHRTLRSVIITILFEPESVRQERLRQLGRNQEDAQDQRIERIQVEECLREYVHSPNLLLAHIHFIQLTMQTTEQTLRSTYRTAGSLMGLWRHFNDLLERVFDTVNRLLTIVETTNAILSYDVKLERFCVKKWFQRTDEEGFVESNMVLVHFPSLTGIAASGVGFKRPFPEAFHLLPPDTVVHDQHTIVGDLNRSGLMFLECLLWNVSQKYET